MTAESPDTARAGSSDASLSSGQHAQGTSSDGPSKPRGMKFGQLRNACPVGRRFGLLVVLSEGPRASATPSTGQRHRLWLCACDCGQEKFLRMSNLIADRSHSCGCLLEEAAVSAETQAKKRATWAAKRLARAA